MNDIIVFIFLIVYIMCGILALRLHGDQFRDFIKNTEGLAYYEKGLAELKIVIVFYWPWFLLMLLVDKDEGS